MGKMERLRLPITVPAVWMVPLTDGWGVQSLIRRVVAGVTNVLCQY